MIVIPTYNEKANIRPLVAAIREAVPVEPILFVDDNSPDRTDDEIRAVAAEFGHVLLSSRPGKLGLGSAYREVFIKLAAENSCDYVITMDGDLSHPPSRLPAIIESLAEYPVVVGSRYTAGGGTENWKLRRRLLSRCANSYARICCGVPARDLTAGFVGYRTELLRKLPIASVRSEGYSFLIEMKYLVHKAGAPIKELPITFVERREGKSKLSSGVAMEAVRFTTRTLFRRMFGDGSAVAAEDRVLTPEP